MMKNTIRKSIVTSVAALFGVSLFAAGTAQAAGEGDLIGRIRYVEVLPSDEGVDASNELMPILEHNAGVDIDADYYLSPNISSELSLLVSSHNVKSNQNGSNMGKVWLASPSLTLKYHFFSDKIIRPYVGAGVNYTRFFGTDSANGNSLGYSSSIAPVIQLGADLQFNKAWSLNLDFKRIYMRSEVSNNNGTDHKDTIDPYTVGVGVGYKF
ncbi:MAG TPA: OmpW family outer membrane protein [Rickettsiales bacterium]|nr:OmpW family outer membrane protein [Rickettsiales bacterium]